MGSGTEENHNLGNTFDMANWSEDVIAELVGIFA
jgi:hypothetical protein